MNARATATAYSATRGVTGRVMSYGSMEKKGETPYSEE